MKKLKLIHLLMFVSMCYVNRSSYAACREMDECESCTNLSGHECGWGNYHGTGSHYCHSMSGYGTGSHITSADDCPNHQAPQIAGKLIAFAGVTIGVWCFCGCLVYVYQNYKKRIDVPTVSDVHPNPHKEHNHVAAKVIDISPLPYIDTAPSAPPKFDNDDNEIMKQNQNVDKATQQISKKKTYMSNKQQIQQTLVSFGFQKNYIGRAFKVYEKNYGFNYNIEQITEIIVRLQNKDKAKKQKRNATENNKDKSPKNVNISKSDNKYKWQYWSSHIGWKDYNVKLSKKIDEAYSSNLSCYTFKSASNNTYDFEFRHMRESDHKRQRVTVIRRVLKTGIVDTYSANVGTCKDERVVWEYYDEDNDKWHEYGDNVALEIESMYHSNVTVARMKIYGIEFEIRLDEIPMNQNNLKTGKISQIRRVVKTMIDDEGNNEENKCVVCMDNDRNYICTPCGHYCLCYKCENKMNGKCPICRSDCKNVQVYE